ncbi:MAG: inositol monophosphatase family protein, partial [Cyanobium sp.]
MNHADNPGIPPSLHALLDRVAERQRADFGHMMSDIKADGTLITACDRWSDATLVGGLADLFPGEGVLSEEGEKRVPASESYWVVDPLDGTTNFAAGIPYWAISLARFQAGVPVLAVLDVPPLHQRIVAIRGSGAWRNGKPLQPPSRHPHPARCPGERRRRGGGGGEGGGAGWRGARRPGRGWAPCAGGAG